MFIKNAAAPSVFGGRCKPCHNELSKEAYWLWQYGISRDDVTAIRAAQDNKCAICRDLDPQHLDHDHSTGGIRKLLCTRCNLGLGQFRDDPFLLQMAVFYVQHHNEQQALAMLQGAGAEETGAAT